MQPGDHDAQPLGDRQRVVETEIRIHLVGPIVARGRGALERKPLLVRGKAGPVLEFSRAALEGALAHEIDRARHRVRRRRGERNLGHLDPRDAVHADPRRGEDPVAVWIGAGELLTVQRNDRQVAGKAADQNAFSLQRTERRGYAGQKSEEVTHAAPQGIAQCFGRDDVLDVGCEALLVDRDGLDVGLAGRRDLVRIELDHLRTFAIPRHAGQFDVAFDGLTLNDRHRRGLRIESGVECQDAHGARRHSGQPVGARFVGEGQQGRAGHGHARVIQVGAGHGVLHPTLDRAGFSRRGSSPRLRAAGCNRDDKAEGGEHSECRASRAPEAGDYF